jgi:hypothetical protein
VDSVTSVEIPIRYNEYPFYVLPAGENGVVFYRAKYRENADDYSHFEFYLYDQNLELIWTSLLELEYMFNVIEHAYSNGYVYIIFSGGKSFKKQLMIYRIHLPTQAIETFEIETFFPEVISYFDIFKNTIVLGGREKSKPSIVFYHLENIRPVILQGFYEKNILIHDVQIDEENELFTVLTGYSGRNNQGFLKIRSYDEFGQPVEDTPIEPGKDLVFMRAKSIIANNNYRLVTGIYKNNKSINATGIFLTALHLDGTRKIQYYPFSDIFDRSDSTESNSLNGQPGTIPPVMFDPDQFQWNATELSEFMNENIMMLESFSTEKGSSSIMDKSEVYRFQKALMIVFNDDLKIRGFNEFDLRPLQSERLNTNLKIKFYEDSLKLTLHDGHQILRKVIHSDFIDQPLTYFQMNPPSGRDENVSDGNNSVLLYQNWYDDFSLLLQLEAGSEREEVQYKFVVTKLFDP